MSATHAKHVKDVNSQLSYAFLVGRLPPLAEKLDVIEKPNPFSASCDVIKLSNHVPDIIATNVGIRLRYRAERGHLL